MSHKNKTITDRDFSKLCAQMGKLSVRMHRTLVQLKLPPESMERAQQLEVNLSMLSSAIHLLRPRATRNGGGASQRCANLMVKSLGETGRDVPPSHESDDFGRPTLRGAVPGFPITTAFEMVSSQRKTGTLRIKAGKEVLSFDLRDGFVVAASTNVCPRGQRLGDILISRGAVRRELFSAFLHAHRDEPGLLGHAMLQQRVVSRADLTEALERQVQMRFDRAFGLEHCSFCFYEGSIEVDSPLNMKVTQLLLESARNSDESLERAVQASVKASRSPDGPFMQDLAPTSIVGEGPAAWGPPQKTVIASGETDLPPGATGLSAAR